jgi:hypothetical protein
MRGLIAPQLDTRVAGCGLRVAGCGLRVAGCGLRVAGCGLRVAGCGLRVAGCGLRWNMTSTEPFRRVAEVGTQRPSLTRCTQVGIVTKQFLGFLITIGGVCAYVAIHRAQPLTHLARSIEGNRSAHPVSTQFLEGDAILFDYDDGRGFAGRFKTERDLRSLLDRGSTLNPVMDPPTDEEWKSILLDFEPQRALVAELFSSLMRIESRFAIERVAACEERQQPSSSNPNQFEMPAPRSPGEIPALASDGKSARVVRWNWGDDPDVDAARLLVRQATSASIQSLKDAFLYIRVSAQKNEDSR